MHICSACMRSSCEEKERPTANSTQGLLAAWCAAIYAWSRTYSRWPQMEKWSTWKSSVLLIWTSLKFGSSPSDFISKAQTMLKLLRSYIQSTIWPIKPPRWPQMEKMIYMDCLRLVESINFDIKIVQIRIHMQKLEQSECSPVTRRDVAPPPHTCRIGTARE